MISASHFSKLPHRHLMYAIASTLLLVLVVQTGVNTGSTSEAHQMEPAAIAAPLTHLLRPDGTIDLTTGFVGSLDPTGWQIEIDPASAPRFTRSPSLTEEGEWSSNFNMIGTTGEVLALALDSSGNMYAGGSFEMAGGVIVNRVAKWDGSHWTALGTGVNGNVQVLSVDNSGNLYAGGFFTVAGGVVANHIAKWDGSSWSALSGGMNNAVYALAVDSNNNLYAGGMFTTAGATPANYVASWDGLDWAPMGAGMNMQVRALIADESDNIFAGGFFTTADGVSAKGVAKWDGDSWSALGGGVSSSVAALVLDGDGNLYTGGWFLSAGGEPANRVAKWDGVNWSPLGVGANDVVHALTIDNTGHLIIGGRFTSVGGSGALHVASWDGSSWSALGSGVNSDVFSLTTNQNGDVIAGGHFDNSGDQVTKRIAAWDGSSWSPISAGCGANRQLYALATDGHGNLYAGGDFTIAGNVFANRIAKWDGERWTALGVGMNDKVLALATDGDDLYAGGEFTYASGVAASHVAKWDGISWSVLGSGTDDDVHALAVDNAGNLYAGGRFISAGGSPIQYVAQWDGSNWHPLGEGLNGFIMALLVDGEGTLYAGGIFSRTGDDELVNNIAMWDGLSWSSLGEGTNNNVYSLAMDSVGSLYVGGDFTQAGGLSAHRVAKWDGISWSAVGSGINDNVQALAFDSSGRLYAAGEFNTAGGSSANRIAMWVDGNWAPLGTGLDDEVESLAIVNGEDLYAGGQFLNAGDWPSSYIGLWKQEGFGVPSADFESSKPDWLGQTTTFTNTSTPVGDPDMTYAWDFGDGGSSTFKDPSHQYFSAGIFTVTLAATNLAGNNVATDTVTIFGPPAIEFQGQPLSGVSPLTVTFSATATTVPKADPTIEYSWRYGDGGSSNEQNDLHVYHSAGNYTVTLTASNAAGSDTLTRTHYITVYEPVTAFFVGDITSGPASLEVTFSNLSTGDFTSCTWDWGDGMGSSDCDEPSHIYSSAGTFTVSLTVSGMGGEDTQVRAGYITVYEPPTANFTGEPVSGPAPLSVAFTNLSAGDFDTCEWNLGDGESSTDCDGPTHNYTTAGTYTVTLAVHGLGGDDTEIKPRYITVFEPVTAMFSGTPTSGPAPLEVAFSNLSTGEYETCLWDFGDGGTISDCGNPEHQYNGAGTFTVSLTISGPGGYDTETMSEYITVFEPVTAEFSGDPIIGLVPFDVTFTNLSSGDFDTCLWDFGDGEGSVTCGNPSHTYETTGTYTVSLNIGGPGGVDIEIKPNYIGVYESLTAEFHAEPTSGPSPLQVTFTNLSVGVYNTCTWDFGDGSASSYCDPTHIYTNTGTYSVSLTINGPTGEDTEIKTNYIAVYEPVSADFIGNPTIGIAPLQVAYSNLSTGDFNTCQWDFGDGEGSVECNDPTHDYQIPGIYTVTLIINGPGGEDTERKAAFITVYTPVTADFGAEPTSGFAPLEVFFSNLSNGDFGTCTWYFGDGMSVEGCGDPSHLYIATGSYTVSLIVSGLGGTQELTREEFINVYSSPEEYLIYLPLVIQSTSGSFLWEQNRPAIE